VCNLETSRMRRPWTTWDCSTRGGGGGEGEEEETGGGGGEREKQRVAIAAKHVILFPFY